MITRIEAYSYRCFAALSLDVGRFHVFAGANGAGKTTLLDIPTLLGELATSTRIGPAFFESRGEGLPPRARGPQQLIYKYQGDQFDLAVEAAIPEEIRNALVKVTPDLSTAPGRIPDRVRYEVRFSSFNDRQLLVDAEYLILYNSTSGKPRPARTKAGDLAGAQGNTRASADWVIRRDPGQTAVVRSFRPGMEGDPEQFEFTLPPDALALANVPSDVRLFPVVNWFRSFLASDIRPYRPDDVRLRQPARAGMELTLRSDAANLPWLLNDLKTRYPDTFADWVDHVNLALPVEDVVPYTLSGGAQATFMVRYPGGLDVDASGLSEGTLRILALTAPAFLPAVPQLLTIEQPEDGLHPKAIESVLASFTLPLEGQVWTSTHSPVVLAHVDLDDIVIVRPSPDGAVAVRGSEHPALKDWQDQLTPGELYAAGILK